MYSIIRDLSESRSFRSESDIQKVNESVIGDVLYAHILALFILYHNSDTRSWAKDYAGKTALHGNFKYFVTTANDLYVLAYAHRDAKYFKPSRLLNILSSIRFGYRMSVYGVLTEIQSSLVIHEVSLKSAKRIVAYWDDMPSYDRLIAIRAIRQLIKSKLPTSDIISELDKVKV